MKSGSHDGCDCLGGGGVRSQLRRKIKSFLLTLVHKQLTFANNYVAGEVRATRSLNLRLYILNKENLIENSI
jgi:hypothetical protein